MAQYERELSNLSYTNKDFQTIYPELLDLTKKISYKWDPTQSDESDPGVVLLKLAALMADKLNYNIDKNILELFPISVTQDDNARQIFDQCGYTMRYYNSAVGTASLTLRSEPEISEDSADILGINLDDTRMPERIYEIPMFTMLSTTDNDCVYTITETVTLSTDNPSRDVKVIQGVATKYDIGGETLITPMYLDSNHRLYFRDMDIAENGIFIKGGNKSYYEWKAVDNLMIQPIGTYCYKFGLSPNGRTCYVEFPTDIDSLIGDGIEITYIRTKGYNGNIGKKALTQFFGGVTATRYIAGGAKEPNVKIDTNNVFITNNFAITSGKDPETIEDAYRNYQRVKNTFKTLVSLDDYTNHLLTENIVSNGYVCDRTNDIQSTHKVITPSTIGTTTTTIVSTKETRVTDKNDGEDYVTIDEPEMAAFDIKLYGLTYVDNPTSHEGFQRSFTPVELVLERNKVVGANKTFDTLFNEVKCIQHDTIPLEQDRLLMLKNKYPIGAKIIPQYKLNNQQQMDVLVNVYYALFDALNSQKLNFGEEISYDLVYDTITNSDPRIRSLILDNIEYETYAVYLTTENDEDGKPTKLFKELRIDSLSTEPEDEEERELWNTFRAQIYSKSVLAGTTPIFVPEESFQYSIKQSEFAKNSSISRITTNTDIDFVLDKNKNNSSVVQLFENENVVFTAPNLIEEQNYSTYTKYFYKFNEPKVIYKNSDYLLEEGEYFIFYWKTADGENTPYKYKKYEHGSEANIICPSFDIDARQVQATLYAEKDGTSQMEVTNILALMSSIPEGAGETYDGASNQALNTSIIQQLYGSAFCVLSGTNAIRTKKQNKIEITNEKNGTRKLFWVLNSTEVVNGKDSCVIHFDLDTDKNVGTYTLKSGEYLFYTNASQTHLVSLGSGTKLEVHYPEAGITPWICQNVPYDELESEGLSYITDKGLWYTVDEDESLFATEMEFYQFGPKTEIKLAYVGEPLANKDATIKIRLDNSGEHIYESVVGKDTELDIGFEKFKIYYRDLESGADFTELSFKNAKEHAWTGYSILNIDCGKEYPQYLRTNHTVYLDAEYVLDMDKSRGGKTVYKENYFVDESDPPVRAPITIRGGSCLASSVELELTGGIEISTLTVDLLMGAVLPTDIASFTIGGVDDDNPKVSSNLSYDVVLKPDESPTTVDFKLPKGKYILPIVVSETGGDLNLQLQVGSESNHYLHHLLDYESGTNSGEQAAAANITKAGKYYLELDMSDDIWDGPDNWALNLHHSKHTSEITVTILPPIKYEISDFLSETENNELKVTTVGYLKELDNGLFDYTYKVPEDDLIENPLDAESFLDTNHIFNKFTICEFIETPDAQTSLTKDISITNKIK